MKWSQAKTILIVFFILIDLFLLIYLTSDDRVSEENYKSVAHNTVEVLKNNGIKIEQELIFEHSKNDSMKTAYVENIVKDYCEFARLILGEDIEKKSDTHYKNQNGEIRFFGDSFDIKALKNELIMTRGISDASDAIKRAKELAQVMGIDIKKADLSVKEENNQFIVRISQRINKSDIFGAGVEFYFSISGINNIKGCWYNTKDPNNSVVKLKTLPGVLIEYMNSIKEPQKEAEITDISLGYRAGEGATHHESLVLTPVWKITDNKGKSAYLDAREN